MKRTISALLISTSLLAGAASSRAELSGPDRAEAVAALTAVVDSPHRISLPPQTLEAARWHLRRCASPE